MSVSPQNSPLRTFLSLFEGILNLLYPSKTPDELSYLGLENVKHAVDLGYQKSILKKLEATFLYMSGVSLDLLDGIRARRNPGLKTVRGQLIDGYCDRMREVIPLKKRAFQRLNDGSRDSVATYLTVLSCFLPSIERAKAECVGLTVPEKDEKGGSSFNRALLLFKSFKQDIFGQSKNSAATDIKILDSNLATYLNRKKIARTFSWKNLESQRNPLERLLLYTELLQKEYNAAVKTLNKEKSLQKEFIDRSNNFMKEFLKVDIEELRRKNSFKSLKF